MGYMNEELWDILSEKTEEEDRALPKERQIQNEYLSAMKTVCQNGIDRAKLIRDTFPMFTLHDETHICNVMRLMVQLLGDEACRLTRDEAAMLILAACWHDAGMSYSVKEKEKLFRDRERLDEYLEHHQGEYVKAYSKGGSEPIMEDDMIPEYLRCIHHERVEELLYDIEWPKVLQGKVDRDHLIAVCQSHGQDIASLDDMEPTSTVDLRFCAILLRLADILDFDTSRAPEAIYRYSGFRNVTEDNARKSKAEWDKHLASQGFDFLHIRERSYLYPVEYHANCKSMQAEQAVNCYLDWVDQELSGCGRQLKRFAGKWNQFILPGKINRNITSEGYVSGQYRLTLDQDKILELFVGKDLYSDPSVFVRELIQNAIDAVRTREQLDKNLPSGWKGQINIRCWMDGEGYHWFRIEDNGIGMTEEMIMNYLLKIGSSYYTSDAFEKSKLKCRADSDYMPISRFGIGILSCFMGDPETNQVEISTKHFKEGETTYPALRLSMQGINGYYYLASSSKKHRPEPMKGVTEKEKERYLTQPGTVIAVRTNLYQSSQYRGFKEMIDRYVIYPPVAIHYDGEEGSFDVPTEEEFMNAVHGVHPSDKLEEKGLLEFPIPEEELQKLYQERPELSFQEPPKLQLRCIPLDAYTATPYLKGAVVAAKVKGRHEPIELKIGKRKIKTEVWVALQVDEQEDKLGIEIGLSFGQDVIKEMNQLEKKRLRPGFLKYNVWEQPILKYPRDAYRRAVFEGIDNLRFADVEWKKSVIDQYKVSEETLNLTISEMEKIIAQYSEISTDDMEDAAAWELYQGMRMEWSYELCSLSELPWYDRYFGKTKSGGRVCSLAVHNGIFCGEGKFFWTGRQTYTAMYNSDHPFGGVFGAVVLFKDKYRPYLDVARDGVRGLTLELASELEIIRRRIADHGFTINRDFSGLTLKKDSCGTMERCCKLLAERKDLAEHLLFAIENRVVSKEELDNVLSEKKMVVYTPWSYFSNRIEMNGENNLYDYLCAAFLRENYTVQKYFYKNFSKLCISRKERELPEYYKKLFPANFFLLDVNGKQMPLANRFAYGRYACNECHRLSQFMIKNAVRLNKHVPGIFKELLRTLVEENGDELIQNVNNLLKHLRRFPGGLFEIPDELFLTEDDLC